MRADFRAALDGISGILVTPFDGDEPQADQMQLMGLLAPLGPAPQGR